MKYFFALCWYYVVNSMFRRDIFTFSRTKENSILNMKQLVGPKHLYNYLFRRILFVGGIGFLLTGISSWNKINLLPFIHFESIQFFPQGFIICFYGILGLSLRLYLFFRRFWSVGSGFNYYDKEKEIVHIFRWGFPGKNRRLELFYSFSEIETVRLETENRFRNPSMFNIYLTLQGKRKILIVQSNMEEISPQEIELCAANLARFLQIPLERVQQ